MKTDIILAGVGGQGILSIANVIGQAALKEGLYIKQAEVHGMSQRGGDVHSNLRISSKPVFSDLISLGQADIIIAMEPMEALRYKPFLSFNGWIVTSSNPFINITGYPEQKKIIDELKKHPNLVLIDTDTLGKENKMPKAVNMILLGAASKALKNISYNRLKESVKTIFNNKGEAIVEMNIKALEIGRNYK
ncbi:MAG TPA: indolepyruvate oxidoreductase subunit beta [Bacteroidaceae bacterium]|nr:indolepyruvate oxidoreductase subunit beta [Bacteroidaceae bacterium]